MEPIPPSREVAKEQLLRTTATIAAGLRLLVASMESAARSLQAFVKTWEEAEIKYAADSMRDCPIETENRLVDWLRPKPL